MHVSKSTFGKRYLNFVLLNSLAAKHYFLITKFWIFPVGYIFPFYLSTPWVILYGSGPINLTQQSCTADSAGAYFLIFTDIIFCTIVQILFAFVSSTIKYLFTFIKIVARGFVLVKDQNLINEKTLSRLPQ